MSKRTVLSFLVVANLALLAALGLRSAAPQAAYAQGAGLAGNYITVAGEIQDEYDAIYMIDLKARQLHAFYYDKTGKQLQYGGMRDLERDFRNNRE